MKSMIEIFEIMAKFITSEKDEDKIMENLELLRLLFCVATTHVVISTLREHKEHECEASKMCAEFVVTQLTQTLGDIDRNLKINTAIAGLKWGGMLNQDDEKEIISIIDSIKEQVKQGKTEGVLSVRKKPAKDLH
jgi:hypothetical protein